MARLSALISLAKFMKHNKSKTAFSLEIVIIFSPIIYQRPLILISSFNLMTELQELIPDAIIIPLIYRSP